MANEGPTNLPGVLTEDRPRKSNRQNGAPIKAPPPPSGEVDAREERLFSALDIDKDAHVRRRELEEMLRLAGLTMDDSRLQRSLIALLEAEHLRAPRPVAVDVPIPKSDFCKAIRHDILLIERALQGNMVVPDFDAFCQEIATIYSAVRENRRGNAANYIPQLDLPEPDVDSFGVSLCTVDGQRFSMGESDTHFTVQSTCKPINYCIALEELGVDKVHQHVGREPSGGSFNALTLNTDGRPHNPLINAGAIMCCSLVGLHHHNQEKPQRGGAHTARGWAGRRFDHVLDTWEALAGGARPGFNNAVFLSERETADRNFALGYFMREKGAFPEGINLHEVLEFYFQCCSIESTARMMSVVAATLANGGICPVSGERVFSTTTVQHCLSLMYSCGMYDYSGEFAFKIGLPAKSGVAGALMIVIPNVMGICTWSPRLDRNGNSVRGIDFCDRMVSTFNFHNYDNLTGVSSKRDPRVSRIEAQAARVTELIWAANKGDLGAIQREFVRGADLNASDYDGRTPLHLAAAEGQLAVVSFFIEQAQANGRVNLNPNDRWGGTPLDDAVFHGHTEVADLLRKAGGVQARKLSLPEVPLSTEYPTADPNRTIELIWAASEGDLLAIRRLMARGIPLSVADYDYRTPLHLAASEGRVETLRFLLDQSVARSPRDRWGMTPLDDARRHGHDEVVKLLQVD
ncbi:MAG: glutaminase A [Myxococcota bacterium]